MPDWNENVFDWKALGGPFQSRICYRRMLDWKAKVVDWKALGGAFQSRI